MYVRLALGVTLIFDCFRKSFASCSAVGMLWLRNSFVFGNFVFVERIVFALPVAFITVGECNAGEWEAWFAKWPWHFIPDPADGKIREVRQIKRYQRILDASYTAQSPWWVLRPRRQGFVIPQILSGLAGNDELPGGRVTRTIADCYAKTSPLRHQGPCEGKHRARDFQVVLN